MTAESPSKDTRDAAVPPSVGAEFVDVQVNGYAGRDFNDATLSVDDWHTACAMMRGHQIAGVLAAVITASLDDMRARVGRIQQVRAQDSLVRDVVWGIHLEGPFIDPQPGYVGAHPAAHARPADLEVMKQLLDAGDGLVRIVTLAPEHDAGFKVTRFLANQGIIVSGGHCNPSYEQLRGAIDAGMSMFTHLGNGCPMQMHRHDNIIQRVLSLADRLWISFIADGAHVWFPALANYLRVTGFDRVVITTDAISAAGLGPGEYTLGSRQVLVDENFVAWGPQKAHLVGSAVPMPRVVHNLRTHLGLNDSDVRRLLCDNPRRLLKIAAAQ